MSSNLKKKLWFKGTKSRTVEEGAVPEPGQGYGH